MQPREDDLLCGYTSEELLDVATMPSFDKVCFPMDECPSPCNVNSIIDDEIVPELLSKVPDFQILEKEPLCREDDAVADECCYWAVFEGINAPPP